MRAKDAEREALRQFKRITDETDAKILRALTEGIARLNRVKTEYEIRKKRRAKVQKPKVEG